MKDLTTGNETLTYAAFGCLAVLTVALAMRDNMRGLLTLLSPSFILFGAWVLLTVVLSLDPGTSIRRFALTACVIAVASTLMLLPKSQTELTRWLGIAALALLAVCYLGILLAPNLSIHLATDAQEPALAGDWRGSFGHKNGAAPVMVFLLFIGIYVFRLGALLSGAAIVGFAGLFLLFSGGKSALALCVVVLLLTGLMPVDQDALAPRRRSVHAACDPEFVQRRHGDERRAGKRREDCCRSTPPSPAAPTSGPLHSRRCSSGCRPATALRRSGAPARSGTCPKARSGRSSPRTATTAISTPRWRWACPAWLLLIAVLVIGPLKDFHAADRGGNSGPLATMLLQIWLFGLYLSSMESFFLDRADPLWFTFLLACSACITWRGFASVTDRVPDAVQRVFTLLRRAGTVSNAEPSWPGLTRPSIFFVRTF